MRANSLIFTAARQRLGTRWLAIRGFGAVLICSLGVFIERQADAALAADNALLGVTLGLCIPFLGWRLASRLVGPDFTAASAPLARIGIDRKRLALGWALYLSVVLAAAGAILGGLTTVLGQYHPASLPANTLTSAWVGALGGLTYGAYFASARRLGPRVGAAALLADWILGSGMGFMAAPWPRAHLRSLLGGEAVLGATQPVSAVVLVLLCLGYLALSRAKLAA